MNDDLACGINPDVNVRSRGVMENVMCIQMTQNFDAKREGRR
jgi:hypothetical protein